MIRSPENVAKKKPEQMVGMPVWADEIIAQASTAVKHSFQGTPGFFIDQGP